MTLSFIGLLIFEEGGIRQYGDTTYFKLYEPSTGQYIVKVIIPTQVFDEALSKLARTMPLMLNVCGEMTNLITNASTMRALTCAPWIPEALANTVQRSVLSCPNVNMCSFHLTPEEKYYLVLEVTIANQELQVTEEESDKENDPFKRPYTPPRIKYCGSK